MLTVFTHVKYTYFPFFKFTVFELFIKWLIRIHYSSIVRLFLFNDALLCRKIGNLTYSCSNFKFCDKHRKFTLTCFGDLGVNRNFSPGASEPIFFGGESWGSIAPGENSIHSLFPRGSYRELIITEY